jgi:hypothetical protein
MGESALSSYVELLRRVIPDTLAIAGAGMAVPVISLILVDIMLGSGLQPTTQGLHNKDPMQRQSKDGVPVLWSHLPNSHVHTFLKTRRMERWGMRCRARQPVIYEGTRRNRGRLQYLVRPPRPAPLNGDGQRVRVVRL